MTKQERDQNNLKMNLQYILDNFEKYRSKRKRLNYLMGISISCLKGTFSFHFGEDPVAVEVKRIRRERINEKRRVRRNEIK